MAEVGELLQEHLQDHYSLYGADSGVRSARKHIAWYVRALPGGEALRRLINTLDSTQAQTQTVRNYFDQLGQQMLRLPSPGITLTNDIDDSHDMQALEESARPLLEVAA